MSLPVSGLHASGPLGEPQPGMLPLPGADCPDQGLQWHHRLGSQLCSQHTHLVPDPRSAVSPDVTGGLHLHPTPQGRGLLLSPLPSLGEPSHAGTGTWFPWQLPGAGMWGGTRATQPRSMEKGVPQGKNFDGKEQADQLDQKLGR